MRFRFRDKNLERLYKDRNFDGGYSEEIVRLFHRRMQLIANAPDERDFYQLKSLHFEKLSGKRKHQRSLRLNSKWRLIVELEESDEERIMVVVDIQDYH